MKNHRFSKSVSNEPHKELGKETDSFERNDKLVRFTHEEPEILVCRRNHKELGIETDSCERYINY